MYAMIFENRMYRVALDIESLTMISNESRIAKIVNQATLIVDLQTNKIHQFALDDSIQSITTSNPLYNIFIDLPLITFDVLKTREPQIYL